MKVVMLGGAGVGKTTVMVSVYGMMSEKNQFQGFHVRSTTQRVHDELARAYREFQTYGRYPASTVRMDSYDYEFSVDGNKCMKFTLIDIRGETIEDYDNQNLLKELSEADVVMVFFNGYDIINDVDLEETYFDLFSLINSSFETNGKKRMLMPVITQMDRVLPFSDAILEKIVEFTKPMKNMADKNVRLDYQVVPTACSQNCMMDLDFLMVKLMQFGYEQEVQVLVDGLNKELADIKKQYGDGILNGIVDVIGLNFRRDAARKRAKEIQPVIDHYNETIVPIYEKMVDFLNDYKLGSYVALPHRESSLEENIWDL